MIVTLARLHASLQAAWSAATSYDAQAWSRANAASGQCAVTACVVQDYLGGDIVWAEAQLPDGGRVSHFFNVLDGKEVDLTRGQFPPGTVVPAGAGYPGADSSRVHILSYPATVRRYELLKHAVACNLGGA